MFKFYCLKYNLEFQSTQNICPLHHIIDAYTHKPVSISLVQLITQMLAVSIPLESIQPVWWVQHPQVPAMKSGSIPNMIYINICLNS